MGTKPVCAECGAPLPENAPGNRCPKCLLQLGLEETANDDPPKNAPDPGGEAPEPSAETPVPPADLDSVVERPGTVIGRYRLLQQIGAGGFGVVFMAEQTEPVHRRVALKVIKAGMDTREVIARFEAERQALAMMDHPNIARVLDGGTTASRRPYFVMELVRGIPITEYCDQANLSTRERLELFIKVCRAVQHAHQKGIIHRDLKPSNVLVTLHDGEPVPKVIDFGVAKALDQKLTEKTLFTRFEQMLGTPAYMSPEQAALGGLDIDTRSDIYSLGVLLYELLTGITPLDAETLCEAALEEIRRIIRETDPPKPSTRLQTMGARLAEVAQRRHADPEMLSRLVRGDLDWITMKCLEKDRQRRYETVNGLAMDLERHLNNEPVVARPPSKLYRFQKLVRRNKLVFGGAALLLVVLMLGAVASTWQALRAIRARSQAREEAAKEEAINRFLNDMLASADPDAVSARDPAKGRNVTVVQVLAAAAGRLDSGSFKDRPAIEAALRQTLGRTYLGLGQGQAAEPQLLRALELNRQLHGDQSDEAAQSLLDVSTMRGETMRVTECQKLAKQVLAMELKLHGKEHQHVARVLNQLATGFSSEFKSDNTPYSVDAAEAAFRQALAIERKFPGSNLRDLAQTLSGLAEVLMYFRRNEVEAERLLREALQIQKDLFGPRHPEVAESLERLGWVLDQKQNYAEAETLCEEAVAIEREIRGPKHFMLSTSLNMLGEVLMHHHRFPAAEAAFREALAIRRQVTPEGLDLEWSLKILAQLLTAQSRFAEAEPLYREALEIRGNGRLSGSGSEAYWVDFQALVSVLKSESKWDELEALYRQVLNRQRSLLGEAHVTLPALLCQFADFLRSCSKTGEAEELYQQAAGIIPSLGPGRNLAATRSLSDSLRSRGRAADAETLFTTLIDIEAQNPEQPNFFLAELRRDFGNLLLGENKPGAAAEQYAQSLPVRRLHQDDNLVWILRGVGQGLLYSSRPQEAETYLREALSVFWKLHQYDDFYGTACIKKDLGHVLVRQGRLTEAEQAYREALTSYFICTNFSDPEFLEAPQSLVGLLEASGKHSEADSVLNEVLDTVLKQHAADPRLAENLQRLSQLHDATVRSNLSREWRWRLQEAEQFAHRVLRAQDPGAIKQWLVLAPLGFAGQNGAMALDQQQIPQEANLRPRAGERVKVGDRDFVWKSLQLDDCLIDFNQLVGGTTDWSVAYAVCYIQTDTAHRDLLMRVGSDDQAKVFLNGQEVYQSGKARSYVTDQDVVRGVELKAGLNVLVFKVVNERWDWRGSARFTDAAGQPVNGIRVTLTPP
jgi:serine/threonine protein kinase/tetratricopeptide (TPR) repeat protein